MGWNSSESKAADSRGRDVGYGRISKAQGRSRGVCAGVSVAVIGLGVVAYFIFGGRNKRPTVQQEDNGPKVSNIANAATNIVKVATPEPAKEKVYKDMSREEKLKYWRDKYGDNLPDNIKPIVYYLENPPQQTYRGPSRPESIFHRKSERQIAAFLSVTPGNWMVKPKVFDKRFDDDFAQSMAEKIEILPTDTEEQRKLKELVINAKKELAARLKAGETPSEIMTATAKELYDLGQYRRNLQKEIVAAQHDPTMTAQDVADTVEAANKMLEAKGLKGLKSVYPAIRQAYLERRAEKLAQKAAQKESNQGNKR